MDYKLYVVVDNNVKIPKGKLAREVAGAVTHSIMYHFTYFKWTKIVAWYKSGFKTIVLKTDDFDTVIEQLKMFKEKHFVMTDIGKTVFKEPTRTCLSLPIVNESKTPKIINELKLL